MKKKKNFFNQIDSKKIYGIAILMMIYHHLFGITEEFPNYISLFRNSDVEIHLATLGKLCVSFFVFLSGYGLCKKMCKVRKMSGGG